MRGTDVVLIGAVGALAIFVGAQIMSRPAAHVENHTPVSVTSQQAAPVAASTPAPDASVAQSDINATATIAGSHTPPPARNIDDIRARIDGTPGTYMPEMVADLNGEIIRWPDRRETGLRVWVQSASDVHDWDMRYTQMARDAFADWASGADGGGVPVRLDFVFDSASSDIKVVWIEKFPPEMGRRVGVTQRTTDQNSWLVAAQISIAIHDSIGRVIAPVDLAGIVRHEAGHALGLGHSTDPNTKMYPVEIVNDIRPADRATLRLLYQLPPGRIR